MRKLLIFSLFLAVFVWMWGVPVWSADDSDANSEIKYQDIVYIDHGDVVEFGNSRLSARLAKDDGGWLSFFINGTNDDVISSEGAFPSIDFQIDGTWAINRYGASCARIDFATRESDHSAILLLTLAVSLRETAPKVSEASPDFELDCEYRLFPERANLERRAWLRKTNPKAPGSKLENFSFQIPGALIGDARSCVVDVPGPFFPNTFIPAGAPYESLKDRDYHLHSAPDAGFGAAVISNSSRKTSLGSWMKTGGEAAYNTHLISDGQRITLRFVDRRAYRLDRVDEEFCSDVHCIEIAPSFPDVLARYREMASSTMPSEPNPPQWIKEMILLEVYPQYYEGGFKGIIQKLPFYREIGFNTLYLMPHWVGGYSPIDLFSVEPSYGTAADLKELTSAAHSLGMRVLFDMVIHGFGRKSTLPQEHPEFFVHDEAGALVLHNVWKSITCDWANPSYQQYMAELAVHDVMEYDIDGYRVDAASYKSPSWDPQIPYPAYKSGSAAPQLLQTILQAMRSRKPDSVLLSEVFGPLFYSVCDLAHDNQTEAAQFLLEKMEKGEIDASHYKNHIASVYDSLPLGAPRVFYSRNHDTSWFYHFHGYTPRFMALEAIHAFFGVPSVFAGDPKHAPNPDDDPAIYAYYKKIFSFKKKTPALNSGVIRLREVECDNPWIFAGVRQIANQSILVVVSLSGKQETGRLSIPIGYLSKGSASELALRDVIQETEVTCPSAGRDTGAFDLTLNPFQVVAGRL